jgi:hypothetical protein
MERATAGMDSSLDPSEYTTHEIEPLLLKMGTWPESTSTMDVVDCTRISSACARRRVQSQAICQFPERMSQVASTGVPFFDQARENRKRFEEKEISQ